MVTQATTTLAQTIPVIVLSGATAGMLKDMYTEKAARESFSEVSREDAIDTVGRLNVGVAKKNPNTIFHTSKGEVMYSNGSYFIR